MLAMEHTFTTVKPTRGQRVWRKFCQAVVWVFYRRCEVDGLERMPAHGPVLLCANHANALADAVIIQAVCARPVHPLARSGLFGNPLLRPVMGLMQAVPVYRRQDAGGDTAQNVDSFRRCYEMFRRGGVLLIFPEGQSHSDPHLRPIKTGAARMVLGAKAENGEAPRLLPVGLNFMHKGKFRGSVLVALGEPIDTDPFPGGQDEEAVRALTREIYQGLDSVTLNVDDGRDLDLLHHIERFFAMRHGKYRRRDLKQRFRALKKLIQAQQELRFRDPQRMEHLRRLLQQFERLCKHWGVRDYHLTVRYRPTLVTRFILRSLAILFIVLPLALWGIINSIVPFLLTRHLARRLARGTDQYDTAKMVLGLFFFLLFWSAQITTAYYLYGGMTALVYALGLPPTAAAALMFRRERTRIWENLRVFFVFVRKRKLRRYLEAKRKEIERELARMVRQVKRKYSTEK